MHGARVVPGTAHEWRAERPQKHHVRRKKNLNVDAQESELTQLAKQQTTQA